VVELSRMRKILYIVAGTAAVLFAAYKIIDYKISAPAYHGPISDHFDGKHFHNTTPADPKGFFSVIKWRLTKDEGPWRKWVDADPGPVPAKRVGKGELWITFVNHSTLLVQIDGLNILTDPIWSERASPVSWAGPRRARPPGIRFEDLPPIDAVVVSHNHYDHLDVPTLAKLSADHHPRIFSGLGNDLLMKEKGIKNAEQIDWWQTVDLNDGVTVTCVPAQHWSGRGFGDRMVNLWCGFVFKGPSGTVYFAGDTGFGPHFKMIAERYGPIDVALIPIGAFRPRWFMQASHLSPEDAIQAHQVLGAKRSIAIHFGTFRLGDDGETEAVDLLRQEIKKSGAAFFILDFGESLTTETQR
jgi:L-ascorbate metabolism protein UlaG (beta-lactamase superfamily)